MRLRACTQDPDVSYSQVNWAGVLNFHFHDLPSQLLAEQNREARRIDTLEEAVQQTDAITAGSTSYLSLHGDIWSKPDDLVLTNSNIRARERLLQAVAKALGARQVPLTIVFWRCEDLGVEDISSIRDALADEILVPLESYFLSEQHNNARDAALSTLDIIRVDLSLNSLVGPIASEAGPIEGEESSQSWLASNGREVRLPNPRSLTNGLVRYFDGAIVPSRPDATDSDFLRGAPPTVQDIEDGRVVRRAIVHATLLPAIRGAILESERSPYSIVITGRAGAGITTLICCCAYELLREKRHPVLVMDTQRAHTRTEWLEAGPIVADISKAADSTVVLFVDAHEKSFDDVNLLVQGVVDSGGSILPVIGGRRETLGPVLQELESGYFSHRYEVHDSLAIPEWEALARVLQRYGYSTSISEAQLFERLKAVGRIIPAIYEATDHAHRKFREIIAFEYESYGRDRLAQKAYRLICALGAFGISLTQFWLLNLKARKLCC